MVTNAPNQLNNALVPPQNIEAEMSTLGSMAIDRSAIVEAVDILDGTDFYRPTHGLIFEAIKRLDDRDEPIDLITLQEELRRVDQLEECGGTEYLMALLSQVPSAARVGHYANIVKEKSVKRRLISAAYKIQSIAREEEKGAEEALSQVSDLVMQIGGDIGGKGVIEIGDIVHQVVNLISERFEMGGYIPTIKTGITMLDQLSLGIQPGLTLICARPSEGKTSLLYQIVEKSPEAGTWLLISPDDSAESYTFRMISRFTKIPVFRLMSGNLWTDEIDKIIPAAAEVHRMPLRFYDESNDIRVIAAKAKYQKLKHNICGILVDYGQLLTAPGESRVERLANVSVGLKSLVVRLKIPVIVALQLNRKAAEQRKVKNDPYPTLENISWCDQFERDANQAYVIHNPKPKLEGDDEAAPPIRDAKVFLAKYKNGATGVATVKWNSETMTFSDIENRYEEEPRRLPYADD